MKHGKIWGWGYGLALTGFTVWLALDTFVIPHVYEAAQPLPTVIVQAEAEATPAAVTTQTAAQKSSKQKQSSRTPSKSKGGNVSASTPVTGDAVSLPQSYNNGQTSIDLTSYRVNNTTVYVADVMLDSAEALSAVLAQNAYGRNVTETPSSMAQRTSAILAVNGDYYGARQSGYVIRNGVLYRATAAKDQEDLVIDGNGDFSIIREDGITAQQLLENGAVQVYSFGPSLIENGQITVSTDDEVGRAMASNPRTALAQVGPLHYLFVVADGRTSASEGLSLYELAQFLKELGAQTAYNLDGGGSSAMVFNGQLVNTPTSNGSRSSERSVSDIVAIF